MKTYVLYHANCTDGFGAAWGAWNYHKENAIYIPVQHGNPVPEMEPESQIYILDFCYPFDVLKELASKQNIVVVIDHHKTSQESLPEIVPPNLLCYFDMNQSGAMMSWKYWWPSSRCIPELVDYIQDRDLWQWKLPQSHEVSAALSSYPMDFTLWNNLQIDQLKTEGKSVLRHTMQQASALAGNAFPMEVGGYQVHVVNATNFISEVCELICLCYPGEPFAASYKDLSDAKRVWSLRTIHADFDVSKIAKRYGGGGHRAAAGFTQPTGWPGYQLGRGNIGEHTGV